MNKICTSIEQSKKLLELGIDVNTADMYWAMEEIPFLPFPVNDVVTDWEYAQENGMFPAWSLSALMNFFNNKAGLVREFDLWCCYDNSKSRGTTKHYEDPIDAAFEMVCWLKTAKYI